MQNITMGHDPRAVANAILDIADELSIPVTNLQLNKALFYAHADCIQNLGRRVASLPFEAWQYGPVMPCVYHEFKSSGDRPIRTRAKRLNRETGERELAVLDDSELSEFLRRIVDFYCRKSGSELVKLSHAFGQAWDYVWNLDPKYKHGMQISDAVILERHEPVMSWRSDEQSKS